MEIPMGERRAILLIAAISGSFMDGSITIICLVVDMTLFQ